MKHAYCAGETCLFHFHVVFQDFTLKGTAAAKPATHLLPRGSF